ncbi:MAG: hypothetical protein D6735_01020, partial [Acidobacteria bacterium]
KIPDSLKVINEPSLFYASVKENQLIGVSLCAIKQSNLRFPIKSARAVIFFFEIYYKSSVSAVLS